MADLCRNKTFYELFFVTLHAMRVGLTNCVCRFKAVIKRVE